MGIDLGVYQAEVARLTRIIPPSKIKNEGRELAIATLGLAGETGQLVESYNWLHQTGQIEFTKEVGDCLCYAARICTAIGADFNMFSEIMNFDSTRVEVLMRLVISSARICNHVKLIYIGQSINRSEIACLLYDYMGYLARLTLAAGVDFDTAISYSLLKLRHKK